MSRLFVSRKTGIVITFDDENLTRPDDLIPLTQVEVDEYNAWIKEVKAAQEKKKVPPPMPSFGPFRLKEDMENVVAEVEAGAAKVEDVVPEGAVKIDSPPVPKKPGRPRKKAEDALGALLNDGQNG